MKTLINIFMIVIISFWQQDRLEIIPGHKYFVHRDTFGFVSLEDEWIFFPKKTEMKPGTILLATDKIISYKDELWRKYIITKSGQSNYLTSKNNTQNGSCYLYDSQLIHHHIIPVEKVDADLEDFLEDDELVLIPEKSELELKEHKLTIKYIKYDNTINIIELLRNDKYYYYYPYEKSGVIYHAIYNVFADNPYSNELSYAEKNVGYRIVNISNDQLKHYFSVINLQVYDKLNENIYVGDKYKCIRNVPVEIISTGTPLTESYFTRLYNGDIVRVNSISMLNNNEEFAQITLLSVNNQSAISRKTTSLESGMLLRIKTRWLIDMFLHIK